MAEVATKKSINVVSSKKNEVCGVQSNNGLIDLDDLTASNNQLISLCDDDDDDELVLTNNTRNELENEDKSLQELIESELALRICSSKSDDDIADELEEEEPVVAQPEPIKRIVLDRRQDPIDINAEFIAAESEHYSLIEEPHQNGHVSPDANTEVVEPVDFYEQEEDQVGEKTSRDEPEEPQLATDVPDFSNVTANFVDTSQPCSAYQENELTQKSDDAENINTLCQQNPGVDEHKFFPANEEPLCDVTLPVRDEANLQTLIPQDKQSPTEIIEDSDCIDANQSEILSEAASTREFLATERLVLSEEANQEVSLEDIDQYVEASLQMPSSEIEETNSKPSNKYDDELGSFHDDLASQSEMLTETSSTCQKLSEIADSPAVLESESIPECPREIAEDPQNQDESSSELSASDSTFIEKPEVVVSDTNLVTIFSEAKRAADENLDSWTTVEEATKSADVEEKRAGNINEATRDDNEEKANDSFAPPVSPRAPLATPDETETSDVSNACDSESREETVTASSTVVTSSKVGTKTKKKKIEGVAGNDATSPNLTPRTKKTKKSKKSDLEKENISVNCSLQDASMHTGTRRSHSEMIDFSDEDDLSNVNVKSLTQNYVSETSRSDQEKLCRERIATGVSIKQLCRSFGDISNMSDGDQAAFGKTSHAMETEEKARSMGDLRLCEQGYSSFTKDAPVFAGVSVKALRASYCSLASLTSEGKDKDRACERPKFEKSSFNKFDALTKKTVLHVRSVDAAKVQQQLNAVGPGGEANTNCRSCGKVVFQMEQTKAEGLVWHKNCFRCVQCGKQLNVDNYESHESTLYCKPHFKELFQPKPVEESEQPVRPRKPELIIRENEPKELPPDVVRASDKPDLGLEELSSLNVKSRFQVFEKASTENANEIERSPSQIAVKRSPSILSKLAKFQAKGMDIGVADESLNGIPYEESSESEDDVETEETEEVETEIVKAKRTTRERPISFSKMDDMKNRWESTSQQGRREIQREARKEEIAGIRSRLFMGKQGKMKEMYQQAVAGNDRVTKINAAEEIQHSTAHARSIKERFERGEPIAASDDEIDSNKPKPEKADEEVIAAGISRKSRSLFLELDASAAKIGRPVTPVHPKTPTENPRRARDAFMGRQVSDDVVRSSDATEEVHVETSEISNKFKFFETYREPEKQRKQFRITPPRDGQVKMDSPDREIYRDPDVVRANDRVDEVVHTDTARKMLSIFRQMEENASKEELPDGPKPLKRFTPPEDKFAKATASDSEEDEEEENEESEGEESAEEKDPNYVRASDKVEDEFLKQAQNAARAKTLRAKFEHWEETDGKVNNHHIAEMEMAQGTGEQSSIESASSLRARFESLGSQSNDSPRAPKVKVNRFVEIQTNCTDVCESCQKKVYPLEKVETNNKIFHKQCFRCLQCNCILRMDSFTLNNGKLYCIPHFKQLFITRGNYDEGFGVDPHKNKWATTNSNSSTSPSPIAVSNGDL
ncbi:LOW QUALITY PROTEIN: microtubule-associated protein futsch [Nylanderia fulva]|uniref:LOW QUALITY PROTEIN: microtubule-associated protein futsch n=1 Tax=Nylanderia fulva TaxID=613905 RepID=UPI0010FB7382|nr:LOW QUALITY PROTEIN: microtubule-associated protein futsch [Nylanderia fulva]